MGGRAKSRPVLTLVLLAALSAEPTEAFERATKWDELNTADGVKLFRREIPDSHYFEYRATSTTDVSLEALCNYVYEWGSKGKDHQSLKLRKLVRDGEDERVTYDHIDEPIVASRDFAMTVKRTREENGVCKIRFFANNAEAPASPRGFVRIEKLWGGWTFEPRKDGKVDVTYTCFADPAGAIPPFLVHGSQAVRARATLLKGVGLARAGEQQQKVAQTAPPAKE
jgi:hypothetical protein